MKPNHLRVARKVASNIADLGGAACLLAAVVLGWNDVVALLLMGVVMVVAGWVIDR